MISDEPDFSCNREDESRESPLPDCSAAMTQRITEMSPRFLARIAAVLGVFEGVASVNGQLRIPVRLVVERWKEQAAQLSVRSMKLVAN
jgi:hypothetical protein